jgi:hypothetical protein
MALRIIRATDPITVERLNLAIYAAPGLGKTSIAFTADAPLLLDFDGGVHRAANRGDAVRVSSWKDVTSITQDDLSDYRTIVIDTAGRALDHLSADIIERNGKMGRAGALTLQGYGQLKAEFIAWLKLLNSLGKDVVLIAHMDEQRNGDEIIERLDVQGGSKNEIYKAADAMGRLSIRDGKRFLTFSPTDTSFGKNPGQLEPVPVPSPNRPEFAGFLAGVIAQIKTRLNEMTEQQRIAHEAMEAWRDKVVSAKGADDVNRLLPEAKAAPKSHQALLSSHAQDLGLTFDKTAGAYVAPAAAA